MERRSFLKNLLSVGVMATLPIPMFEQIVKAEETKKTFKGKLYAPLRLDNGFWLFDMEDRLLCLGTLEALEVRSNNIDISSGDYGYAQYIPGRPSAYFRTSGKELFKVITTEIQFDKQYKAIYIKDKLQVFSNVYVESLQAIDSDSDWQLYNISFVSTGTITVEIIK